MSKVEIERFAKLLREWTKNTDNPDARDRLQAFLLEYERPLVNALRIYACDK